MLKNVSHGDPEFMRLFSLDAARGISALCIVLFHLYSGLGIINDFFIFVDFFFVLSGFVLASSVFKIEGMNQIKAFVWNRYVRLFPMAYSALLFVVAIQVVVNLRYSISGRELPNSIPLDLFTILASVLFLQVFYAKSQLLLYPLWSLSVEWIANLLSVFLSWVSIRNKIICFIFLGTLFVAISMELDFHFALQQFTNQSGRGLLGFGLGLLTWNVREAIIRFKQKVILFVLVFMMPMLALFVNEKSEGTAIFMSPILFSVMIWSLFRLEAHCGILPPIGICRFLGRISYGVYVWHVVGTNLVALAKENWRLDFLEPQSFLGLPRLVTVLFLTLILTELTLRFVEIPLRKRLSHV